MHYLALATDYDGTLATNGTVSLDALLALRRLRASGRKLVLVTGRELEDLMLVFPQFEVFDSIVAENGALLYTPRPPLERPLAEPPPSEFAASLRRRGVSPLSCGRIIVATTRPHEHTVLSVIREQGLELEVIFNKESVMVLPSGINKASGLAVALADLDIPAANVVAIGDAENDHSLLAAVGLAVAVANAVPAIAARADLVTRRPAGAGVTELCDALIAGDLAHVERRHLAL